MTQPSQFDIDEGWIKAERQKARILRRSQWWKRRVARGRCHYCGRAVRPADLTMDHIVPLARGGRSKKGNVVPACKTCNTKKKTLVPVEWKAYLESIADNSRR
ncbi:MAG: HNH endonuclease [Deltaproteobacteria bacterium]|nr:HNH endonuclease [Deltaproteobacteria bacterium]